MPLALAREPRRIKKGSQETEKGGRRECKVREARSLEPRVPPPPPPPLTTKRTEVE